MLPKTCSSKLLETKVKHRGSGFESWHIQGKVYSMYMEVFLEEMSLFMGGGGRGEALKCFKKLHVNPIKNYPVNSNNSNFLKLNIYIYFFLFFRKLRRIV